MIWLTSLLQLEHMNLLYSHQDMAYNLSAQLSLAYSRIGYFVPYGKGVGTLEYIRLSWNNNQENLFNS